MNINVILMHFSVDYNYFFLLLLPLWFDLCLRVGIHDVLIYHFVGVEVVMIHRPHRDIFLSFGNSGRRPHGDIFLSFGICGRSLRITDHLFDISMVIVVLSLLPGLIDSPSMINRQLL